MLAIHFLSVPHDLHHACSATLSSLKVQIWQAWVASVFPSTIAGSLLWFTVKQPCRAEKRAVSGPQGVEFSFRHKMGPLT